jgi:hypothetical protein
MFNRRSAEKYNQNTKNEKVTQKDIVTYFILNSVNRQCCSLLGYSNFLVPATLVCEIYVDLFMQKDF